MFTGLVEEIGKVATVKKALNSAAITIKAKKVLEDVNIGDSILTNGICLTVTAFNRDTFTVDVMAETMRRTNLHQIAPGTEINLERALMAGGRLGGHLVSGHIDGTGSIRSFIKEENAVWITISAAPQILKYVVEKGSIAIDGVSLTVAYVNDAEFKVSIIPHTKEMTTLLKKNIGDTVNLECDMIGKYVEKFLGGGKREAINMRFLQENGFA
ncbi:riboflavin synthase [Bacillaceae bacterium Marseille-Q3522]|nr:riboflavin synthase [Bacillaceae bacterium Marseille-Q3522]